MTKKKSLRAALMERHNSTKRQLVDVSAALAQGTQAIGVAVAALPEGVAMVAGAIVNLAGMAFGLIASSLQNEAFKDDLAFIADQFDRLPGEWAEDGTLEQFVLPAVSKFLLWRMQETHKDKVDAARKHLARKLLGGPPDAERDSFHQEVEKFLNDCTVTELVCLIRMGLAFRTGDKIVNWSVNPPKAPNFSSIVEETLAEAAGVSIEAAYYAFRSLDARGFVESRGSVTRHSDAARFLPPQAATGQNQWTLSGLAHGIAKWLDEELPPELEEEFVPIRNGE